MDLELLTQDQKERILIDSETSIARLRGIQLEVLEDLDRDQAATADGCRSLSEWVGGRMDLGPETAKALVRTMRRTTDRVDLRQALADGELSFDRVEALSRIPDEIGSLEHLDVAGVRREAALRARMDSAAGSRSWEDRYLVLQPSLDESWWRMWGGLDGASGALVDKALTAAAETLPPPPNDTQMSSAWYRATALTQLCVSDDPPPTQVTVFVDTAHASPTSGEAGVVLEAGPRVGREALQALLCDAVTEVTVIDERGRPMEYGRRSRSVPPALRRSILFRDGNACTADGCDSRSRLQIHHLRPWSEGGPTDPDNLITLCWYHHQVVVHQQAFQPYRHPEHGRIRFRKQQRGPPS